jgi:hypothetical protein
MILRIVARGLSRGEHHNMRLFKRRLLTVYLAAIAFFVAGTLHMALADEPISKYIRQTAGAETVIVFVHGYLRGRSLILDKQ